MYGYIYITKNLLNNKFYIGQHKANKFDNSYYGSGKILIQAINKYGKENFSQQILSECETKEDLDDQEKYWIKYYYDLYPSLIYNLAKGGEGGDVFYYQSQEDKNKFIKKMTTINRARCASQDFKDKISKASQLRYCNPDERLKQSKIVKKAWSDQTIRDQQSQRLKHYYKTHTHDGSYNNIKCCFELNSEKIFFNSIKDLQLFLKNKYSYIPAPTTFKKLMEQGKQNIQFTPFHKNKLKDLIGMKIYKIDDDVETNRDECSGVEVEISTTPKDEAYGKYSPRLMET